jgi:hypothetical protein
MTSAQLSAAFFLQGFFVWQFAGLLGLWLADLGSLKLSGG